MRIMIWNIQFFTLKRIINSEGNSSEERIKNLSISTYNYNHIANTILEGNPDVFIMIEPRSQAGALGSLATGGGPDGLYYLYEGLHLSNNNWRIVPPLKTVNKEMDNSPYTEAVGVFYRSDTLEFIGPWLWPAANNNNVPSNGPAIPNVNNPATGPYPGRWNGTMPANNQGITYAAQFRFLNNNNQEIWFPNQDSRRPILTNFREVGVQNPRTFKIFSCHTTPNTNAKTAVALVAGLAEAVPGNNEVTVLAGDFNVDYLDANPTPSSFFSYMRGILDYTQCFGRANVNPNTATTTKRVNDAIPESYLKNTGLDNVFVMYGPNVAGAPANPVIIDRCAGVPNTVYDSDMEDDLDDILDIMDEENQLALFRDETNYGHIGNHPGTSDHLALVVDL